jgi:hypothetical protein
MDLGATRSGFNSAVIAKAGTACKPDDCAISDHFADVSKMVAVDRRKRHSVRVNKTISRLVSVGCCEPRVPGTVLP